MPVPTTTIGSYPKPSYLRLPNFKPKQHDPTRAYSEYLKIRSEEDQRLLVRASEEVVRHQVEAGIEIPTDGEMPREHYIYYHLRHLEGFDFVNLTEKRMRNQAWHARIPTLVAPVRPRQRFLPEDWRMAQRATKRPVKMTVPGPLTIADSVADAYYRDERALGAALADAINVEVRALADAGCPCVQVDEPVFAREPQKALAYGMEHLERCFHKVPAAVTRVVHICCGYPAELNLEDYPKADAKTYFALADDLEQVGLHAVSLEDAHRHNDLKLLEKFPRLTVILGVVQIANTRVEPVEEIVERLRAALGHIDRERLIAAPDCGLAMLEWDIVWQKLRNVAGAAGVI
ncbi:MAG: cobalamin-independent methionine synthase II family protein [SAR324 cluster bacterium]|nr:cobalamin-independent methionine synthase II family protein [SAR324 cluster bacterium]